MSFENFDYDKFADAMRKGGGAGSATSLDPKDLEKFKKGLADYTKEITKAQSATQTWTKLANGQRTETINVKDALKDLNKAIDDTVEAEKRAVRAGNKKAEANAKAQRAALEVEKASRSAAVGWRNVNTGFGNLAVGLRNLTGDMINAAADFVSGLQSGKEGAELYGEASVKAAKSTGEMIKSVGDVGSAFGSIIEVLGWVIPGLRALKWVGLGIMALGEGLKIFGPTLTEGAVKAAEAFNKELINTKTAFKDVNSAGMNLTNGMTELRDMAVQAGYELTNFARIVKDNQDNLSHMGMGVTRSTKMFSELSKGLLESKISNNLYNLGYGMKEQGDLMLFTMNQMTAAGKTETEIRNGINESTLAYGKSLKIISDITGKDAKKQLERAAEEAMDATVYSKVFTKFGADGVAKMEQQFALMTEQDKKAYKQKIALDGRAYTDVSTHLRNQASGGAIDKSFNQFYRDLGDATKDMKKGYTGQVAQVVGDTVAAVTSRDALGRVSRLAGAASVKGGVSQDAMAGTTEYIKLGKQLKDGKVGKEIVDNVNAASNSMDPLTKSVYTMDNNVRKAGAEFTSLTTGPLKTFGEGLVTGRDYLKGFADKLKELGIKVTPTASGKAPGSGGAGGAPAKGTAAAARGGSGTSVFQDVATALGIKTGSQRTRAAESGNDLIKFAGGKTGDKAHFDALAPKVKENFMAMIKEYGKGVTVTSAFRSFEEQAQVDSGGRPKAKPGSSLHNVGSAIDLDQTDVAALQASGLLGKYGFQGLANDPVHIQAMDKGGSLLSGETALVGEKGPEIVSGPGNVTSTANTNKVFVEMNKHLADLVKITKDHKYTSEKMLRATA